MEGIPLPAAARAVGLRHPPAALPPEAARHAGGHRRHRREEPEGRGALPLAPGQARRTREAALRALPGARGRVRHRIPRAGHQLRAADLRDAGRARPQGQRAVPGLPEGVARLPRLRPDLRRRDRQVARRPRRVAARQGRPGRGAAAARLRDQGPGRRLLPPLRRHGVQRQHRDPAAGRHRDRAHLPRPGHRRPHAPRADVHALQGGLLRVPVARGHPHLPRQRPGAAGDRRAAQVLRRAGGLDPLDQGGRAADPARPRHVRDGPLPRHRRLPLHLRHRRDPGNARRRRAQGQDRAGGHLRGRPRRPSRHPGPGGPARRGGARRAGGGHARRHHQEPPSRGAGHRRAPHLRHRHTARLRPAAALRGVVHGRGGRSSSSSSSPPTSTCGSRRTGWCPSPRRC